MSSLVIGLIVVGSIILLWIIAIFNGLVNLNVRCNEAFADIDVQTKRRYDLIPNLVETVKGYAAHEKGVFEEVTKARTAAMNAKTPADRAEAENMLTNTLKSLFAVAEAYPDLKANQNFLDLQTQLTETEDKIEVSRRYYNANVREFNIKIAVFPTMLVAGILGFKTPKLMFEAAAAEREAVKVQF
ncbi:MAG: LemA family protein [Patescibacteria group bacterium]|nr:LemA family protein [Patescibacteria group bacterium]